MTNMRSRQGLQRESGAVLVISLIVLLVVTLLGVGALETAVFQERMSANAQNKNLAFQGTASILEDVLRDENVLGGSAIVLHNAIVRGVGEPGAATDFDADDPVTATYSVTYMGESGPFAREGQETSLSSPIPRRRFELRLTTVNENTQAGTSHIQGFVPN